MKLFGYKVIALIDKEEVKMTVLDKYRKYHNESNYDVYLCKDNDGAVYSVNPLDIIKFL